MCHAENLVIEMKRIDRFGIIRHGHCFIAQFNFFGTFHHRRNHRFHTLGAPFDCRYGAI